MLKKRNGDISLFVGIFIVERNIEEEKNAQDVDVKIEELFIMIQRKKEKDKMKFIYLYCRGECKKITPHSIMKEKQRNSETLFGECILCRRKIVLEITVRLRNSSEEALA